MRKMIIAFACLIVLCITTCVAFAEQDEFVVYMGSEKMTATKDGVVVSYYVNGPGGTTGTVTTAEPEEWNAKLWYDVSGDALMFELKNLDFTGKGVRAEDYVNVVLNGNNKINRAGVGYELYGIYAEVGMTISDASSGSLDVVVGNEATTCYGICSDGDIVIEGGSLKASAGKATRDDSAGIFTGGKLKVTGGNVEACGGITNSDVSSGICALKGIEIMGGNVKAVSGNGSYGVGIYCNSDLMIGGDAIVYAKSGDGDVEIYSYGTYVREDLIVEGNAQFISEAGAVNDTPLTSKQKRCYGIYLGDNVTEDGNAYVGGKDVLRITGGTVIAKADGACVDGTRAVVLYDAEKIEFSGVNQTNEYWYQWKIEEDAALINSGNEPYPDATKWQSATGYFHIEPIVGDTEPIGVVKKDSYDKSPATGDNNMVMIVWLVMALTGIGACSYFRKRYCE